MSTKYLVKMEPFRVHVDGSTTPIASPMVGGDASDTPYVHHEVFDTVDLAVRCGRKISKHCFETSSLFEGAAGVRIIIAEEDTDKDVFWEKLYKGALVCPHCGDCYPVNSEVLWPETPAGAEPTRVTRDDVVFLFDRQRQCLVYAPQVLKVDRIRCSGCGARSRPEDCMTGIDMLMYKAVGTRFVGVREGPRKMDTGD